MYLDDIEGIAHLRETSEKIEIENDDYDFESVAEIRNECKDRIKKLKIAMGGWLDSDRIRVEMKPSGAKVSLTDDTVTSALGVAERITRLLLPHQRFHLPWAASWLANLYVGITTVIAIGMLISSETLERFWASIWIMAWLYWLYCLFNEQVLQRRTGIYPYPRSERPPGFFT